MTTCDNPETHRIHGRIAISARADLEKEGGWDEWGSPKKETMENLLAVFALILGP